MEQSTIKYDLTCRMMEFLDLHLVIPIFEFLVEHKVYDLKELYEAKLELLRQTKMVDYLAELHETLYDKKIENHEQMHAAVVDEYGKIAKEIDPIFKLLGTDEATKLIERYQERDARQLLDNLIEQFQFHPDMYGTLYKYCRFHFDCGNYEPAYDCLVRYGILTSPSSPRYLSALWGRLACSILGQRFDEARDDMLRLKNFIDNTQFESELHLLQQRAYFIHWSLFVLFNHPSGRDEIIDMFLNNNAYLNSIQILCPHILRYLTGAVILNRRRRQSLRDLIKIIELESYHYRDPITEFVECLYIRYDFDMAQQKLRECEEVIKKDFFLVNCLKEFIDSARMLTFEIYCRLNRCVSIGSLSSKLGMTPEDTEKWVVSLIRQSRLDAKLDAKKGHIIVGSKITNVYETVMEGTKTLSFRAQSLGFQLEKFMLEADKKDGANEDQVVEQQMFHNKIGEMNYA